MTARETRTARARALIPTIDKHSPFAVEVAWWLAKSLALGLGLTLLPLLAFGPPLWWLASVNYALLYPDLEHVIAVFYATVLMAAWGGGWTVLVIRKGVSR